MIRLVLGFVAAAAVTGGAVAQPAVERGSYLVNTIMTCGNCHSPKGPPAAVAGKDFSGGLRFDEPPFDVTAPNITPDKETGIGNWTDEQIKTMLLTGKNPQGVQEAEVYADGVYPILDAGRSQRRRRLSAEPCAGEEQGAGPGLQDRAAASRVPGAEKSYAEADLERQGKEGVLSGHHRPLHGVPHPVCAARRSRFRQVARQGRPSISRPWGVSKSRNITSHKTAGIGDWTDAEIKTAITQGKRKDGTPLKGPMGYPYYAKMTDADLDAVIAYLRTVPAKE